MMLSVIQKHDDEETTALKIVRQYAHSLSGTERALLHETIAKALDHFYQLGRESDATATRKE